MMKTVEMVYSGKDNSIDLVLKSGLPGEVPAAEDLSSVTRMVLELDSSTSIDSAASSGVFDWSGGSGTLVLSLGGETITAGTYNATLVVFDPGHTNGIVWGKIPIKVE